MQVDGVEEELPDEVENACSDDSKMIKYTHKDTSTHPAQSAFTQQSVFSDP